MKRRRKIPSTPTPRTPPLESSDERSGLASLAAAFALGRRRLWPRLRRLPPRARRGRPVARRAHHLGPRLQLSRPRAGCRARCRGHRARRLARPPLLAGSLRQRHPARRGRAPRKIAARRLHAPAGEIRRRTCWRSAPASRSAAKDRPCRWARASPISSARFFRRNAADARILLAAGAGAGLATAFSAPIAGSVFVLEELMRRFDTRITIATLGASAAAIGISRVFLGVAPDFPLDPLPYPALGSLRALPGVRGRRRHPRHRIQSRDPRRPRLSPTGSRQSPSKSAPRRSAASSDYWPGTGPTWSAAATT